MNNGPSGTPVVLVVAGPGERPDGWREVLERHAERSASELAWAEAATDADVVAAVREAAGRCDAVIVSAGDLADRAPVAAAIRDAPMPIVWAEASLLDERGAAHDACARVVHGRGRRSFSAALQWATSQVRHPPMTRPYGPDPAQVGDLRLPQGDPAPVAVLLHGGFWLDPWERDLMDGLAVALTTRGWATWNVEYRRLGPSGGGFTATLDDACRAVDAVADLARSHALDLGRLALVGHSAGAQLATYCTARHRLPDVAPGAPPRIRPAALACLAGLLDLEAGARDRLGDDAVHRFLDLHAEDAYELASPVRLVPLDTPTLLLHGSDDAIVPPSQSETFADAARRGGEHAELRYVDSDHFAIVDPTGPALPILATWLDSVTVR